MVLLRPLFVASLGSVLVHADSTSATNSSSSASSNAPSSAAAPSSASLISSLASLVEHTGAALPTPEKPPTVQLVGSAKSDVQTVQDVTPAHTPAPSSQTESGGGGASSAPLANILAAAPSPSAPPPSGPQATKTKDPSVPQMLHIANPSPSSPSTDGPENQQTPATQPADENTSPSPTSSETTTVVTPAPVLGGLLSKFAALFAKTEQTALSLEGPQTSTASDEPLLNSILSHNPVLSNIFRPLVAVTAVAGSGGLQGPGVVAPVIGGSNSPISSDPSVGGMIASGINSRPTTPAAPGGQNQIIHATPTTSLPGQLVNIGPSTPAPQSDSNTNQQSQQGALSQGFVIGSQTLAPGAVPQVISGTTYSLGPSASTLYINNLPYDIQASSNTHNDLPYVLPGGSMVQPGSAPITVSGTTYSLAAHGSTLYINGVASVLPSPVYPNQGKPTPFVINGHTIAPGSGPVVIDGQTYSVAPATAGGALYVNGTKVADPQNFALLTMAIGALQSALGYPTTTSVASDGMLTLVSSSSTSPASPTPSKGAAVPGAVVGLGLTWGIFGAVLALL